MKKVLDHGFVNLVDKMGSDYSILKAARTSTGNEASKGDKKDRGLIRYLYRHEHLSPFEFVSLQFHIRCPIFVARQWMRHRTFSFNEASARYKEFEWETFTPEEWRIQDIQNKQSSNGLADHQLLTTSMVHSTYDRSRKSYESMLGHGVAREQARTVMPVGQYTEFFASINLRNLLHFLELRMDSHAQYEIRVFADAIYEILTEQEDLKWTIEVFDDMRVLRELFREATDKAFKNKNIEEFRKYLEEF